MRTKQFVLAIFSMLTLSCSEPVELNPLSNNSVESQRKPGQPGQPLALVLDAWEPVADFPTRVQGAVSFTISDRFAFVGTGAKRDSITNEISHVKEFWRYDPSLNVWTQIADFGGGARAFASAFSIGSRAFVGLGVATSDLKKDFWEYVSRTNTWIQRADFAGMARYGAVGLSIGSRGYIGTGVLNGVEDSYLKDFWEYNPAADQWIQRANFSGKGRALAGGFTINNEGYLGLGFSNGSIVKPDFWKYTPATNVWTRIHDMDPSGVFQQSGFFSINGYGYAGGFGQLWQYDPIFDEWTRRTEFPGIMHSGVGFALQGHGYIGTGNYNIVGSNDRAFFRFTP